MIGYLNGEIVRLLANGAIVLTQSGTGYTVYLSEKDLRMLKNGDKISLFIETLIGEDFIKLYGFQTFAEQDFFNHLRSLQGLGPKNALAILALGDVQQIISMILKENESFFTAASGVGAKIAKRIITELKEKMQKNFFGNDDFQEIMISSGQDVWSDVASVLVNLGYEKSRVTQILSKIDRQVFTSEDIILKKALEMIN